uniref:Uncharacterized protein n=1 Tax=viral metagenome TaxID=1070528 RepID=A0A6M3L2K2_9ZZZZ
MAKKKAPKLATEIGHLRKVQGDLRTLSITQTDQGQARLLPEIKLHEVLSLLDSICDRLTNRR